MTISITAAESEIMDVLWRNAQPMASEDVFAALAGQKDWTHGTVRTLLTRLVKKKALATAKEGRRFLYSSLVARGDYLHAETKSLIDRLYDGRVGPLLAHFSERQDLSDKDIAELKALIERLDRGN